eukprot:s928_g4.t1
MAVWGRIPHDVTDEELHEYVSELLHAGVPHSAQLWVCQAEDDDSQRTGWERSHGEVGQDCKPPKISGSGRDDFCTCFESDCSLRGENWKLSDADIEEAHLRWREACALQKKLCDLQTSGAQKPKTLQEFPDLQEEMIMLHTWKFRTKERMRSLLWRQQGLRKLGKPSSDALRAFAGRCCAEGTLTGDWRRCHDVCCILGGSGAGKSTLLNVLAGRQLTSRVFHIDGELRVNGRTVEPWRLRPRVAYVMQKDEFFATETPREAILFSARLRLPASHLSVLEEKGIDSYIGQLLDSLGLSQCCDRRIGGASLNGISNGERKRVSIGVELITRPSIVFLDEPTLGLTTGLDSFSAWQVMRIVKDLADSGCTVVCTIHQPSSERAETDGVWPQHPVRCGFSPMHLPQNKEAKILSAEEILEYH